MVQVKKMRLVQVEKQYIKNLNADKTIKSICNLDLQPQCLICMKISTADSIKPYKLKGHLEIVHPECVGKTLEFSHSKLNEFNNTKQAFAN